MISIIVCSRSKQFASSLSSNIEETIGCDFELHIIENAIRKASIFDVYNEGISKSKGNYLVFVHEDVKFITHNWGQIIIRHFKSNPGLGLIGVAGTHYLSKLPMAWWFSLLHYENVIQTTSENRESIRYECCPATENEVFPVCAIDGVFMCTPAYVFSDINFDGKTFKGFHMYDCDISLQILQRGYSVACIPDILIEHYSYGCKDKAWYDGLRQFNTKWEAELPLQMVPFPKHNVQYADFQIALNNIMCLKKYNYPIKEYIRLFWNYVFKSHFSLFYFTLLLRKSFSRM